MEVRCSPLAPLGQPTAAGHGIGQSFELFLSVVSCLQLARRNSQQNAGALLENYACEFVELAAKGFEHYSTHIA